MANVQSFEYWKQKASELTFEGRAYIDGELADAHSGDTFDCISPLDSTVLTKVASCDQADADIAIATARQRFNEGIWSSLPPSERKRILLKFADLIVNIRFTTFFTHHTFNRKFT